MFDNIATVQENTNAFSAADAFFAKGQQVGDLDLTNAVTDLLRRLGVNTEAYLEHPQIKMSIGKSSDVQLFLNKEFWNYQLLALQENMAINTLEDRLLVQQFIVPKDWFTYFANNVLDLVLAYGMPYRHGW